MRWMDRNLIGMVCDKMIWFKKKGRGYEKMGQKEKMSSFLKIWETATRLALGCFDSKSGKHSSPTLKSDSNLPYKSNVVLPVVLLI